MKSRCSAVFPITAILTVLILSTLTVSAQNRPVEITGVTHGAMSEIRFRPFVYIRIRDLQTLSDVERVIETDPDGQLISVANEADADFFVAFASKPASNLANAKSGFALPQPSQISSDHTGQMVVYTKNRRGQVRIIWTDQKGSNRPERAMSEFLQTIRQGKPKSGSFNYQSFDEKKQFGLESLSSEVKSTILYREHAKLTKEAREHDVEGSVALSVIFGADSQISDLLVLRGLPYGVTANCLTALKKIRFTPAMKDGHRVSVRSTIYFEFTTYR